MSTVEDFLHKFHSLEGNTIGERRKNFFILLNQNESLKNNPELLDSIVSNLLPKTYLESLFKVDFLIYFRRTQDLFQLLKEGNDIFVSKISKQIWFFKEAFNEIGANELINEILPNMSFSVRMKVLRKLSRYSENFDAIFDAVAKRYGMFRASLFITGCSSGKIRQVLSEYFVNLTSAQLRILHGKDRKLIEFYFKLSNNEINSTVYKNFVKFLFVEDRDLYDKFNISREFGRRATKRFVADNKNLIIMKPDKYNFLYMKAVIRKMGKDSVQLFTNALPAVLKPWYPSDWVVRIFPKKYHYNLCVKVFQAHYNIKFVENPNLIHEDLLNLISDNSERAVLAKVKLDEGEDEYLKYLLTKDSIPLIKEKINFTSDITERGKLIRDLIETCRINKDLDALSTVMKYFCFRHKNDDLKVHLQFILNIEDNFELSKFTEQMWSCLNELLTVHMLKFDHSPTTYKKIQTFPLISLNVGTSPPLKLSYLEFLFKNGAPIDELITEYFTTNSEFPDWPKYDQKFGKHFLLHVINSVPEEETDKNNTRFKCILINRIDQWNRCYQDDKLSFYDFPKLVAAFNQAVQNVNLKYEYSLLWRLFSNTIFTTEENYFRTEYLEVYWERFAHFGSSNNIRWFLKHDPLTINNHFDQVFKSITKYYAPKNSRAMWHLFKKFSHLKLDQKSIEKCLSKFTDEYKEKKKETFILCLSVLMKPEDYASFAKSYKPANKKLDLENESEVRLYNLQCCIASELKRTRSYKVLPCLLHYCAGDYFKYALPSLYSLLYRTPEKVLPEYLSHLSTKAVSVRKHALYMTCELGTPTKVESMIKLLNKTEKVKSLQKYMFLATIKYFVKNPSDEFFDLVKKCMIFVKKTDGESLKSIVDHVSKIPRKYKADYVQYSWEFLEKTVEVWNKLERLEARLLSYMTEDIIKQIPLEFGVGIIEKHFMKTDSDRMMDFTFDFLRFREEKKIIFEKIFAIVDQCTNNKPLIFLYEWYDKIMKSSDIDLKYLEPYVNYFESKVSPPMEDFSEFLKIFFLRVKLEDLSVDELSERIFIFFQDLLETYGPHVTPLFTKEVDSNLHYITRKSYDVYYGMVESHPLPDVAVLVLNLISVPAGGFHRATFNKILRVIKKIDHLGVQLHLRRKFKDFLA